MSTVNVRAARTQSFRAGRRRMEVPLDALGSTETTAARQRRCGCYGDRFVAGLGCAVHHQTLGGQALASIVLADVAYRVRAASGGRMGRGEPPRCAVAHARRGRFRRHRQTTELIPARVVWLPPVPQGERRVSVADVLVLSIHVSRPPSGRVDRRKFPDRVRVVQGPRRASRICGSAISSKRPKGIVRCLRRAGVAGG